MQGPVQSTSPHILLAFAVVPAASWRILSVSFRRTVPATAPDEQPCVNGAHCVHRHASPPRTLGASQLLNTRHYAHDAAARRRNAALH
ncbi:hypothetical protein FB451DRAFT_1296004 [Mycena latifolia]|nr:hypothetical protein FB451DRAFT_1296004 [Mycena latifolia]